MDSATDLAAEGVSGVEKRTMSFTSSKDTERLIFAALLPDSRLSPTLETCASHSASVKDMENSMSRAPLAISEYSSTLERATVVGIPE